MENNFTKKQNTFISEEEKTLDWLEIQQSFKKVFGNEVYTSWLQKISLVKEYNDYLILGVPTRFFRDWIVSRYLDKILKDVKSFKLSLNRIEFKIIEENKLNGRIDSHLKVLHAKSSNQRRQAFEDAIQSGEDFISEAPRNKELISTNGPRTIYCLLYTSPSPRDKRQSRMPSSA